MLRIWRVHPLYDFHDFLGELLEIQEFTLIVRVTLIVKVTLIVIHPKNDNLGLKLKILKFPGFQPYKKCS